MLLWFSHLGLCIIYKSRAWNRDVLLWQNDCKTPHLSFLVLALQDFLQFFPLLLGEGFLGGHMCYRGFLFLGFVGWEDQSVTLVYTFQPAAI